MLHIYLIKFNSFMAYYENYLQSIKFLKNFINKLPNFIKSYEYLKNHFFYLKYYLYIMIDKFLYFLLWENKTGALNKRFIISNVNILINYNL